MKTPALWGGPEARALSMQQTMAASLALDEVLARPLPKGAEMPMTDFAAATKRLRALREMQAERSVTQRARIGDLEKRGNVALDAMDQEIDNHERDISAFEDEVNQVTNGGPPLAETTG